MENSVRNVHYMKRLALAEAAAVNDQKPSTLASGEIIETVIDVGLEVQGVPRIQIERTIPEVSPDTTFHDRDIFLDTPAVTAKQPGRGSRGKRVEYNVDAAVGEDRRHGTADESGLLFSKSELLPFPEHYDLVLVVRSDEIGNSDTERLCEASEHGGRRVRLSTFDL